MFFEKPSKSCQESKKFRCFFYFSKTLFFLLEPLTWLTALCLFLLIFSKTASKKIRFFSRLIFGLFYLASTGFVSSHLFYFLESAAENTYNPAKKYDYIIVLSGYVDISNSDEKNGRVEFGSAVERMLTGVELLEKHPEAKLVFSGGNGSLNRDLPSEAALAGYYAREKFKIAPTRIIVERDSRNTFENAFETLKLLPKKDKLLLITSAFHMPRALGTFRVNGWEPDTLPVDYKTNADKISGFSFEGFLPASSSLRIFTLFTKEIIGTGVYWLKGYYSFSV